ncbi:MAG TPA: hypothetical protein ENN72_02715 [Firmicutes bacterium]|nr:hypothetical protein [Bacillota bacterium]
MKTVMMCLFLFCFTVLPLMAGEVEYALDLKTDLTFHELTVSGAGEALYIRHLGSGEKSLSFPVEVIAGARRMQVRIYLIPLLGQKRELTLKSAKTEIPLQNTGGFRATPFIPVNEAPEELTLSFQGPHLGILSKISFIYSDSDEKEIVLSGDYEGVNRQKGIITASGFGRYSGDSSPGAAAERAAKLDAYRNLGHLIREMAKKEGLMIDDSRFEVTIKGARVVKKELTKEGVVVTVGLYINGTPGLSDMIKEAL